MISNYSAKKLKTLLSAAVLTVHLLASLTVLGQIPAPPPSAPVREVTDDYFGTKITDPYRWMEEPKSKELDVWMKAQNDYTRSFLSRLTTREKFLRQLEEQNNST